MDERLREAAEAVCNAWQGIVTQPQIDALRAALAESEKPGALNAAQTLARLSLQSERYQSDAEYRDAVDAALAESDPGPSTESEPAPQPAASDEERAAQLLGQLVALLTPEDCAVPPCAETAIAQMVAEFAAVRAEQREADAQVADGERDRILKSCSFAAARDDRHLIGVRDRLCETAADIAAAIRKGASDE